MKTLICETLHFLLQLGSLIHYGEEWAKLCDLVSYCEAQMEATLQLLVQVFVFFVLFSGKINPSPAVLFSIATSVTITIAAAKALIPLRLQNSQKESFMTRRRKAAWVITLNILLFTTLIIIFELSIASLSVLFFGIEIPAFFNNSYSELEINIITAMHVFQMIYIICACLLIKFNCLRKFQQVEPKSFLISIGYFISDIVYAYCFIAASKAFTSQTGDLFIVIFFWSLYLYFLCLTLFFGVATFSAEKFTDIWDVDKFNSKFVVSCPRLTSVILLTLRVTATQCGLMMLFPSQ